MKKRALPKVAICLPVSRKSPKSIASDFERTRCAVISVKSEVNMALRSWEVPEKFPDPVSFLCAAASIERTAISCKRGICGATKKPSRALSSTVRMQINGRDGES